jgi:uncharacterized protein (TIGR02466 family)
VKKDIFSTPLYVSDLTSEKELELVDRLASLALVEAQKSQSKSDKKSNEGDSFHTISNFLGNFSETDLHTLLTSYIVNAVKDYGYTIRSAEINYWSIVSRSGAYNKRHNHPDSLISGAFYVSAPTGSGKLLFCDPRYGKLMETCNGRTGGTDYHSHVHVVPAKGRLVLFPSFLEHEVEVSTCSEPRIIYSFNVSVV